MVTQQQCAQAYRQVSRVTIGATKLCAGEGTRDTCNGDSGGGLFSRWTRFLNRDFEINTTLNFRNLGGGFAVVGVTSFGVECARDDFPGVYTRYKKNLFSPRIKTTLFCSGSMSICRGFNKTWARHEANFWNQTFILKILVFLPQYIFMLSSGQNLNSLHINHYAYHSLVKRKYWQALTNIDWKSQHFFFCSEKYQKNSLNTRVWPLWVGRWGMMCLTLQKITFCQVCSDILNMLADIVWFFMAYYGY